VVDKELMGGWTTKLERGMPTWRGKKFYVGLTEGALVVRYRSRSSANLEEVASRFREVGLREGEHFTVKTPKEGERGYFSLRTEGVRRLAWLSVYGVEAEP